MRIQHLLLALKLANPQAEYAQRTGLVGGPNNGNTVQAPGVRASEVLRPADVYVPRIQSEVSEVSWQPTRTVPVDNVHCVLGSYTDAFNQDEFEDEALDTSFGPLAAPSLVDAHMMSVYAALSPEFPRTSRPRHALKKLGSLQKVVRDNSKRPQGREVRIFPLGIDMPEHEHQAEYEVVTPAGYQFSNLVGFIKPRTERELLRQIEFMQGADENSPAEHSPLGLVSQDYRMPNDLKTSITKIRNEVIAKYANVSKREQRGDVVQRKRQTGNAEASGYPSVCNTDPYACPNGQFEGSIVGAPTGSYACYGQGGTISYYYPDEKNGQLCYRCFDLGTGTGCSQPLCAPSCA